MSPKQGLRFNQISFRDRNCKPVGVAQLGSGPTPREHSRDLVESPANGVGIRGLATLRPRIDVGAAFKENRDGPGPPPPRGHMEGSLGGRPATLIRVGSRLQHPAQRFLAIRTVAEVQEVVKARLLPQQLTQR